MNSSGHKIGELLLVLVTGVCLAASGSFAGQSPTSNSSAPKPASLHSARSTQTTSPHTATKKTGTRAIASLSATHRRVTSHAGSTHYAARKTTPHTATASAAKTAPNRTAGNAPHHKGSPPRHGRPRPLTGQQRLARLHLQPERVEEIQQALTREGYLQGDASGQWDSRTHEAMMRYQADHGFPATGLPEAKSLMKLGLGSHPLPPELDHSTVGVASPAAAQGDVTATPPSPPVSQAIPPS